VETEQDQRVRDPELGEEWAAAEAAEVGWVALGPARAETAYVLPAGREFRIRGEFPAQG